jgi:hypothetical protein
MFNLKTKCFALLGGALLATSSVLAQDSKALIDALVKKGILTTDEANQIVSEVKTDQTAEDVSTSGDKYIKKVTITGRFQAQYVGFGASIDNNPVNPVSTEHFFLRRIYVGVKADFGSGLSGAINYDLANTSFDLAVIEWKQSDALILDAGLKKAPFGYEELTSSGNLRSIERSPITRYIDESNNGRRLGASSYRTGLFASGSMDGFFYSVALTNPERNEYSSDGATNAITVNGLGGVATTGGNTTNTFAYYGTGGYSGKFDGGNYKVGAEGGFLPDQGGPAATLGNGNNISLLGFYADINAGNLNLEGEWEQAKDDQGAGAGVNASPSGFWIQPAYKITPEFEAVVRYSYVDSDHRGVAISDGIRSAPSGGTMDKLSEWFVGGNWYIRGNDFKLQAGYIHGESKDTVAGGPAKAQTDGVRSQLQVNF